MQTVPLNSGSDLCTSNNHLTVAPSDCELSVDSGQSSQPSCDAVSAVTLPIDPTSVLPSVVASDDDRLRLSAIAGSPDHDEQAALQTTAQRESLTDVAMTDVSSVTVMLDNAVSDICRICHSEGDVSHPLIQPCLCAGSLRFVHHPCLQKWILESSTRSCELCRFQFIMSSESKPFSKWRKLDLSSVERRRVICSVSFHIVALICVVWSLWVLLERTAEEVNKKNYGWAFWTKLVVVTVGFTGGVVFMYVQCKMYIRLCRRWRTYNRIIYIQDRRPPGQRYCEGSAGSECQQQQLQQQQFVVIAESHSTPPLCKPACCGNVATAQSNPVTVYTVL